MTKTIPPWEKLAISPEEWAKNCKCETLSTTARVAANLPLKGCVCKRPKGIPMRNMHDFDKL